MEHLYTAILLLSCFYLVFILVFRGGAALEPRGFRRVIDEKNMVERREKYG
jgi:hypothetical protein